jgi:tetratricopeptide (TPR) repeat protein
VSSLVRDLEQAERALGSGDLALAERRLRRVLVAAPTSSKANELMAYVAGNRGDPDTAHRHLLQATALAGASAMAWYYLGFSHRRRGEGPCACAAFEKAISMAPAHFSAWHDLGLARFDLGQAQDAVAAFERASAIKPESVEAQHNRGRALHALRDLDAALAAYDRALSLRPDFAPSWFNRGETLNDLRRYDEAVASYEKAAACGHDRDDVDWNLSLTCLVRGDFARGFEKYEARWKGHGAWPRRHVDIPAWTGGRIEGKRLLVWAEQGLGDTLQFSRYVPLLHERGASIVFEVQSSMKTLLARLPHCEVVGRGEPVPRCDLQIPLLSLPRLFGTTLETIPAKVPYLEADSAKVALWEPRLAPRDGKPRVAIACSGQAAQKDDAWRSIPLAAFAPLATLANLHVVQPQLRDEDRRALAHLPQVRAFDAALRDFDDSAAILAGMDRVITIDTSLAHLAGALAKPTWILCPWTPTWRWLESRSDSPWYPTARLFRQEVRNDWQGAVDRVVSALRDEGRPACC